MGTNWKLYYFDSTTYSSEDGDWSDAPITGVVGLGIPHKDHGRQILSGDVYLLQSGHAEPQASDIFGVLSHLLQTGVMQESESLSAVPIADMVRAGVKFGLNVDNDEWAMLQKWMVEDADTTWHAKSGSRTRRERG